MAPPRPVAEYADLLWAAVPGAAAPDRPAAREAAEWEATLRLAEWHRLGPLLYARLAEAERAPAPVLDRLRDVYRANAARNLFLLGQLAEALDALAAASIASMPLKGAALLESGYYPDRGLRQLTDLDLLVPAVQLPAATAALADLGYRPAGHDATGPSARWSGHHHGAPLVAPHAPAAVELHHHLLRAEGRPRTFDVAGVWERASPARPGGGSVLPSPEDLLMHLCLHFSLDRRRGRPGALGQLADIARVVGRGALDWPAFSAATRAYGLAAPVGFGLFAAREIGVAVPAPVLAELRSPDFDEAIARQLIALRVFRTGPHLRMPSSVRAAVVPGAGSLDRWGATDGRPVSLLRAYGRRGGAALALLGRTLAEPRATVRDLRLRRLAEPLLWPGERR